MVQAVDLAACESLRSLPPKLAMLALVFMAMLVAVGSRRVIWSLRLWIRGNSIQVNVLEKFGNVMHLIYGSSKLIQCPSGAPRVRVQ